MKYISSNNFISRSSQSNKTHFGRVLVLAGSSGMQGAAVLAIRACSLVGSGYIYYYPFSKEVLDVCPEAMLFADQKMDAVLMGPGLGSSHDLELAWDTLETLSVPAVIDASALGFLAHKKIPLSSNSLLTPHEGEMARLLDQKSSWVRKNPQAAVQQAAETFQCHVLLKGHMNYYWDTQKLHTLQVGSAALATPGSGDVLSGLLTGLIAQKPLEMDKQVLCAIELHGQASIDWQEHSSEHSFSASLLLEQIPKTLKKALKRDNSAL